MAVSTQLTARTARLMTMRVRRGTRFVSEASGTVNTTTVAANTVTSRPMRGSPTWSSLLMSGRRPVGIISIVTERNTAAASTTRPSQGNGGAGTRVGDVGVGGDAGVAGVAGVVELGSTGDDDDIGMYLSGWRSPRARRGAPRMRNG